MKLKSWHSTTKGEILLRKQGTYLLKPINFPTVQQDLLSLIWSASKEDLQRNTVYTTGANMHISVQDEITYFQCIYVPLGCPWLEVLWLCHDAPITLSTLRTTAWLPIFWWPHIWTKVKAYVDPCECCACKKTPWARPLHTLLPLETPTRPWSAISLDSIVEFPGSSGHTVVLMIMNCLTKMAHFIPCSYLSSANQLLVQNVACLHRLPDYLVSDWDPQFCFCFRCKAFRLLDICISTSTAYHCQIYRQIERVTQVLEQYLRCFVNYYQYN